MNAADSTTMALSTRKQFFAAHFRQNFSLPDSMIYFIAKNPKSSEVYQKLIQCCKYFRHKNPILVFHCLQIDDDGWKTCSNESECRAEYLTKTVYIKMESLSGCKLWIQYGLRIHSSTNPSCASDLIPFMYQCDAKALRMVDQNLSLRQFLFLSRNVIVCSLQSVTINSDAGTEIHLEEIVTNLPYLTVIWFEYGPKSKNVSSDTVKSLLRIPHFKNINRFALDNISEKFDIDSFFDYYKKMETKLEFHLFFNEDNFLSEEYTAKIEDFITYVSGFPDQSPPVISYLGQDLA